VMTPHTQFYFLISISPYHTRGWGWRKLTLQGIRSIIAISSATEVSNLFVGVDTTSVKSMLAATNRGVWKCILRS
jgi:hypothetical protein